MTLTPQNQKAYTCLRENRPEKVPHIQTTPRKPVSPGGQAVTFPVLVQEHRQQDDQRRHDNAQHDEGGGVHSRRPGQLVCGENKHTHSTITVDSSIWTGFFLPMLPQWK